LALVAGIAAPACMASGTATVGVETTPVVYQQPPEPQIETQTVERPGFLWVKGRWDWRANQWTWIGGHWEARRAGYAWTEGRWERRGNAWHWIDGQWTASAEVTPPPLGPPGDHFESTVPPPANGDGGAVVSGGVYVDIEPPAPRVENRGPVQAGFVWISGRWQRQNNQWQWVDGHWERERRDQVWVEGRWDRQGRRWMWVEGHWDRGAPAPAPVVRDHRH
jgi:hypothetical protein